MNEKYSWNWCNQLEDGLQLMRYPVIRILVKLPGNCQKLLILGFPGSKTTVFVFPAFPVRKIVTSCQDSPKVLISLFYNRTKTRINAFSMPGSVDSRINLFGQIGFQDSTLVLECVINLCLIWACSVGFEWNDVFGVLSSYTIVWDPSHAIKMKINYNYENFKN